MKRIIIKRICLNLNSWLQEEPLFINVQNMISYFVYLTLACKVMLAPSTFLLCKLYLYVYLHTAHLKLS